MGTEHKHILTVNAGSSSIKLALFSSVTLERESDIKISDIGEDHSSLILVKPNQDDHTRHIKAANHTEAISEVFNHLSDELDLNSLEVIGHRVVHGGQLFKEPTTLSPDSIEKLRDLSVFDPEHMPVVIELIEAFNQRAPETPQVACFDTTFYHDLPKIARLLPLPRKLEHLGLRRYGFHGLSYESLLNKFKESAGETALNGRIILAHLGSGASLSAVKNSKVLDTTMSLTPASGIPMSTRSGDLDPGIADFLYRKTGISFEAFNHMVHFESGLLGVSELSPDMHKLIDQSADNPKAADAVNIFCYQARKAIGSLTTVLGGLDSLIFSGGIGENSPIIRAKICENLDYLGIVLDSGRNNASNFLISAEGSRVGVHVLQSDEATVIASQTKQTLAKSEPVASHG